MWKALFQKYRQFILYYMVGTINTVIDFSIYSGVFFLTGQSLPSQTAGYLAGVVSSFCLNRGITFREENEGNILFQMATFFMVNLVSLGVSLGLIYLLTSFFGLNGYLAKIPTLLITSLINYFGYKLLVFKGKRGKEPSDDLQNID
ncbi:MAG: GtrA family protein [Oscillospiraceae bacterium]|nr:GtrA family protein [Oscillospiraceae bacterium]